jgi:hypothetical protein
MGSWSLFQAAILGSQMSTTTTSIDGHLSAMTAIVGPPTYPAPMQQIFTIFLVYVHNLKEGKFNTYMKEKETNQNHSLSDLPCKLTCRCR